MQPSHAEGFGEQYRSQPALGHIPRRKTQRNRISLACHECHYRKVRCDGAKPLCGACRARGRTFTCQYGLSPDKERQKDVFGYIDRLEKDIYYLKQAQLATQNQQSTERTLSSPDASRSREGDHGQEGWRTTPVTEQFNSYDSALSERLRASPAYVDKLSEAERQEYRSRREQEPSSTIGFLTQLQTNPLFTKLPASTGNIDGSGGHKNIKPSSVCGYFSPNIDEQRMKQPTLLIQCQGPSPADSPSLMRHLLETYFSKVHCLFPFLHRPTWQGRHKARDLMEHDRKITGDGDFTISDCMTNLVFALGALYSPRFAGLEALYLSETYFLRAKRVLTLDHIETPSLETAQILLLMTQYSMERCYLQRGHLHACRTYLTLAIRVCQALGIHKRSTHFSNSLAQEVSRRVWSACVYFDVSISIYFGQFSLIHANEHDNELPCAVDDEFISDREIPIQSPQTVSTMTFYIHAMQLAQITRQIYHEIYAGEAPISSKFRAQVGSGDFSTIRKLELALHEWSAQLPSELGVSQNGLHLSNERIGGYLDRQATTLHLRYCHTAMLLYRACLSSLLKAERSATSQETLIQPSASVSGFMSDDIGHIGMEHYARMCVSFAVQTINYVHSCMNLNKISFFRGSNIYLLHIYTMLAVLCASKCCLSRHNLLQDPGLQAWKNALAILRIYDTEPAFLEIPLQFFEEIDRRFFSEGQNNGLNGSCSSTVLTPQLLPTGHSNAQEPVDISCDARQADSAWNALLADWMSQNIFTTSSDWPLDFEWLGESQGTQPGRTF